MKLIRHAVAGLVLFAVLAGLLTNAYTELEKKYDIEREPITINGTSINKTIMERMDSLVIFEGLSMIIDALENQKVDAVDIIGALILGGIGLLVIILGIFAVPFQIANILSQHYNIPSIIPYGILVLMTVYIAFILISFKARGEV